MDCRSDPSRRNESAIIAQVDFSFLNCLISVDYLTWLKPGGREREETGTESRRRMGTRNRENIRRTCFLKRKLLWFWKSSPPPLLQNSYLGLLPCIQVVCKGKPRRESTLENVESQRTTTRLVIDLSLRAMVRHFHGAVCDWGLDAGTCRTRLWGSDRRVKDIRGRWGCKGGRAVDAGPS